MPKVPIICRGGPLDGEVYELEAPRPLIPNTSDQEPGWVTRDREPAISGVGYYRVVTPTEMEWVPELRTP